ncbi:MAG: hypothetical protein WBX38_08830 [Candidatus Sulfotelmatobacter sp.]
MSLHPFMVKPGKVIRSLFVALLLSVFFAASISVAHAQSFTFTLASQLSPPGVDPGGASIAILDLQPTGGFNSPVTLTCTVSTLNAQAVDLPTCPAPNPSPVTPPATPTITVSTVAGTSPGQYTITVTATSGSITQLLSLNLGVEPVTESYNISAIPTTATPNPVVAGSQATTTVTVTPNSGYSGTVTLACLSISPVVTPSPICSFNPPTVVAGSSTVPPTSILTITTSGPIPTTRLSSPRVFYAFWLAIPALALIGAGASRASRRRFLGIFLLTVVAGGLILLPSCGSNTTTDNNGVTPTNTYTFTLTGTDANGVTPSTTTPATVTAVVN